MLRRLATASGLLAAGLVGVGFAGALHPAGDSFAVFRVPLAVLATVLLAMGHGGWMRLSGVLAMLAVLAPHVMAGIEAPPKGRGGLLLYQQNLRFDRQDSAEWLAAVVQRDPDVLTLQEVSTANLLLLEALRAAYPYQVHCPFKSFLGEAVLSRYPLVAGSEICSERDGVAAMQIDVPDGPLWVASVHLNWPWPHGQASQVDQLLPVLERLQGRVIVAGDFNAVAWSHTVARIEAATGTRRVGPYRATFHLPILPMPVGIDHVLASGGLGQLWVLPKLGSDHHGLLARIVLDDA